jgi:hypothetical protein
MIRILDGYSFLFLPMEIWVFILIVYRNIVPLQTVPFQEYPLSQLQRNDPTVLMHLFWGQLSIDRVHSLMSKKKHKK